MTITDHTVAPEWIDTDKLIGSDTRDRALKLAHKVNKAHEKLEQLLDEAMDLGVSLAARTDTLVADAGEDLGGPDSAYDVISHLTGWAQLAGSLGSLSDSANIDSRLSFDKLTSEVHEQIASARHWPDLPQSPLWLDLASIVTDADRGRAAELAAQITADPDAALSDGTLTEARDLFRRIDAASHRAQSQIPEPGAFAPDASYSADFDDGFRHVLDVLTGCSVLFNALKGIAIQLDPDEISADVLEQRAGAAR